MAHVQKRTNGKYRVRYRDPQNRERSKTFERKADAERFRADVTTRMNTGTWVTPEQERLPFGHFADRWLQGATSRHRRGQLRVNPHPLGTAGVR